MKHWMFSCNDVSQKVSESMDRILPFHQRMIIRLHLQMCKYCARFRDQMLLIRKALRTGGWPDEKPGPPDASFAEPRQRIKQALTDQIKKKSQ